MLRAACVTIIYQPLFPQHYNLRFFISTRGKRILCLQLFCCARNLYNKCILSLCKQYSTKPIGCGFEGLKNIVIHSLYNGLQKYVCISTCIFAQYLYIRVERYKPFFPNISNCLLAKAWNEWLQNFLGAKITKIYEVRKKKRKKKIKP